MAGTLQEFKEECTRLLEHALQQTYPDKTHKIPRLAVPPNPALGELSSSVAHEIARATKQSPKEVAMRIVKAVTLQQPTLVSVVEESAGYVNFRLDYSKASPQLLETIMQEGAGYGIEPTSSPLRISVEHTSANPSGPLHLGHARNAILGDALARLLQARGHRVNRRFYIDDVGRQVSILAYGYSMLKDPKPTRKIDHWFGRLYACANCALQIETTKKKLQTPLADDPEKRAEFQRNLDEWVGIAAELQATDPELFTTVTGAVRADQDPEKSVQDLGRKYEQNDQATVELVRRVAKMCLGGIRSTLDELGAGFDTWDWESQVIWDGSVAKALSSISKLPFTRLEGTSVTLDINAIIDAYSLREFFNLSPTYEVPSLTLVRSDGTTLYPTRDIAYTLAKFKDSDRVINVIASEQSLPQLQIRVALYAIGERVASENLVHYSYGLVELPEVKMSKRRARYIALDDVLDQARKRVVQEIGKRTEEPSGKDSTAIVNGIALAAIKFAMLNLNSVKNLMFTWDRVLSLEKNSAPFINYAYTRAGSILRKVGDISQTADAKLLTHPTEKLLLLKIGQLPDVFVEAADQLKPEELANYANSLAEKFHEYYEKVDVIHSNEEVKNARAMLVRAVQIALRNATKLLGIELTERM